MVEIKNNICKAITDCLEQRNGFIASVGTKEWRKWGWIRNVWGEMNKPTGDHKFRIHSQKLSLFIVLCDVQSPILPHCPHGSHHGQHIIIPSGFSFHLSKLHLSEILSRGHRIIHSCPTISSCPPTAWHLCPSKSLSIKQYPSRN